jgi:hypothetical protein
MRPNAPSWTIDQEDTIEIAPYYDATFGTKEFRLRLADSNGSSLTLYFSPQRLKDLRCAIDRVLDACPVDKLMAAEKGGES